MPLITWATDLWRRQRLTTQFLTAAAAVFIAGMAIAGAWTANRIESGVTHNTATATALYFESFVAPAIQDLATSNTLPVQQRYFLSKLISDTPISQRVVSFKIWGKGGFVAYATNQELIGKTFPITPKLHLAWTGHIAAELSDLDEEENESEKQGGVRLLEVYVPIREENSERIIAVAEFYEKADQLERDIFTAKLESWLIIGTIALCAVFALFGIVGRASRTIDQQKLELERRISQLQTLLGQNQNLRARIQRSSQNAMEVNEQHLRRLGAELHDGPAQLLGLALLRLDSLERSATSNKASGADSAGMPASGDASTIRTALRDALDEIRDISVGLSLPALDQLSMSAALQAAVRDHARRTNTSVEIDISAEEVEAAHATKTAAFRFVQESLNNASRHAGPAAKKVKAFYGDECVTIEVSDTGKGFDTAQPTTDRQLGLVGMRERIESLGGEFSVTSSPGIGTILRAKLPLNSGMIASHE
jgi:signal transduction histidine kinase